MLAGAALCAIAMPTSAYAQDDDTVKIGFAVALSGWMAAYDADPQKAAVLKIEEINEAGGLLGRQIEYDVVDTKTDPNLAVNAAKELVDWGAEMMVVSADYDMGSPSAFVAQNEGLVAISTGASDPKMGVQGVGPNVYSAHTAAQVAGIVMAEYADQELGFKTAYQLEDVSIEATKSACAGFRAAWENAGGTLVGRDTFEAEDSSIAVQITRIKGLETQPDFIFLCATQPQGATAVRQLRAADVNMPIMADTGMGGDYWLGGVPGLKDFYVPTLMSIAEGDPREEVNEFLAAYEERWGEEPTTEFSILGYCTIEMWAQAVEKAQSFEAKDVIPVMNAFADEPTTCGPTSFSEDIHIQLDRPQIVMRVEDGKFRPVGMFRNEFVPDLPLLLRVGQN